MVYYGYITHKKMWSCTPTKVHRIAIIETQQWVPEKRYLVISAFPRNEMEKSLEKRFICLVDLSYLSPLYPF